jgi:pSer/pThr/pTyr-binding forkhead associated (FHA) protein
MFLYFINTDGKRTEFHLAGKASLTFGRSPEADISLPNTKVSRLHAEIKSWDGDYVVKDLKSRNGTFVNGTRVEVSTLKVGDIIRVGDVDFHFEKESQNKGTQTIVREVTKEIEEGKKGYRTILREIVQSTETKPRKP